MKNITFFETLSEYTSFVQNNIIKTDIFKQHPFYRGLIDFIIDNRSPLFFNSSQEYEYAHFSQYFNFVLMREYDNPFVKDMFYMHDFLHMVFDNPINIKELSFEYFSEITNYNEYIASNDTEILTYYRLPQMREKSLSYPILYDLLITQHTSPPSIEELLTLRKKIILDKDDVGFDSEDSKTIFTFLRKFKDLNPYWNKVWYETFPEIKQQYQHKRLSLPITNYEETLINYKSEFSEERYQYNILYNIQIALQLLGETNIPTKFSECKEAVKRLENRVILEEAAQKYNEAYVSYKK